MQRTSRWIGAGLLFVAAAVSCFADTTEVFRNEKVIVTEETLAPGEQETVAGEHPSVVVFLNSDGVAAKFADGTVKNAAVDRGEAMNEAAGRRIVTNTGHAPLKLVRVEFLTAGSDETWGMTGLAPNYEVLFEDQHSRTYDIRIAAPRSRCCVPERCAVGARPARWKRPTLHAEDRRSCMAARPDAQGPQSRRHRFVGHRHRAEVSSADPSGASTDARLRWRFAGLPVALSVSVCARTDGIRSEVHSMWCVIRFAETARRQWLKLLRIAPE
jgi:hypothetical protein